MSFRRRLIGSFLAVVLVTLFCSFATVSLIVGRAEERQLDEVLRDEAAAEARHVALAWPGVVATSASAGGDVVDVDIGGLPKYAAVYASDGHVLARSPSFVCGPPPRGALPGEGHPFNLWCGALQLRGLTVRVPAHPGQVLLLAGPRTELEEDAALLRRAMLGVLGLALLLAVALATGLAKGLTRDHRALAEVVRQVAAGDLSARVRTQPSDRELAQLRDDINEMITRLSLLVESQQRFIAHAAHELRSPLTTLYGELSHALRRDRDAAAYREAIVEALDATRRLRRLAEDLLALARLGAGARGEAVPVKLREVVAEAAALCAGPAEQRGVVVVVTCTEAFVQGQAADLVRMVRNLVENAIAHTPKGGEVTVTGRVLGAQLEVLVEDQGPGVPEEVRARIFEPFYRGSRERASTTDGAGLGLAIAREVARAHRGEIMVASRRPSGDAGACFVIHLPMESDLARDGLDVAQGQGVTAGAVQHVEEQDQR